MQVSYAQYLGLAAERLHRAQRLLEGASADPNERLAPLSKLLYHAFRVLFEARRLNVPNHSELHPAIPNYTSLYPIVPVARANELLFIHISYLCLRIAYLYLCPIPRAVPRHCGYAWAHA